MEQTPIMPFTGERFTPEMQGNIQLEHHHRYLFAKQLVSGKTVLDIASGEGYGSALLAEVAKNVIGVDISETAVAHSKLRYRRDNLEFRLGTCAEIPVEDYSLDAVVSFETIEHHPHHHAMLRAFKRALRPDGIVLLSSPDKMEYSIKPGYQNPYHPKELFREEFISLLSSYFKNLRIYGQKVITGSAIFAETGEGKMHTHSLSGPPSPGLSYAIYQIALASDTELPEPGVGILES